MLGIAGNVVKTLKICRNNVVDNVLYRLSDGQCTEYNLPNTKCVSSTDWIELSIHSFIGFYSYKQIIVYNQQQGEQGSSARKTSPKNAMLEQIHESVELDIDEHKTAK